MATVETAPYCAGRPALGVPTLEGICPSCDALSDDAHFCDPCEDLALDEWPESFGVSIRRFVIGHEAMSLVSTASAELTRLRALPEALLASFDARAKALDLAAEKGSAGPCALTEAGREAMRAAAISIRECASTVRFLQQHPEMLEATDADG